MDEELKGTLKYITQMISQHHSYVKRLALRIRGIEEELVQFEKRFGYIEKALEDTKCLLDEKTIKK